MFLNLFKLVFHLHHDVLHLGIVAFAARGVYFPAHLLSYETELLALTDFIVKRLTKIFQMVGKALLLLVYVKFLDVLDEFLLEAVLVILNVGYAL